MPFFPFSRVLDEVILHIGLHKTGTTSIQHSLYENKDILKSMGYLYPSCFPPNHSVPMYSAFCDSPENYYMNIRHQRDQAQIKKYNEENLLNLEKEIYTCKIKKLIISGEELSNLPKHNLEKLKKYLEKYTRKIKVIIYVRNPVSWSTSLFQEALKGGHSYESASEFVKYSLRDLFQSRVGHSLSVFRNVTVYKFEDAIQHEHGLLGHFLTSIGVQDVGMFNEVRGNESISLPAADILSYINEKMPLILNGQLHPQRKEGDIEPLINIRGKKFSLPHNMKKQFYDISLDDAIWLKERVGIDYTNIDIKETEQTDPEFTEQTIKDIKMAYFRLTDPLKDLLNEYLILQNGHWAKNLLRLINSDQVTDEKLSRHIGKN